MRAAGFAFLVAVLVVSPVAGQATSADEQAVRAVIHATGAALNARDYAAAAQLFAEDGDVILPTMARTTGRNAIRAFWQQTWSPAPAERRITLTIRSLRFLNSDVAIADATAEFSVGEPDRDRATYVLVRRGAEWQIAALRVMIAERE